MLFADRREAGRRLAAALAPYEGTDTVVLALPRGGVPVAYEVARALHLPLDIMLVRKLGVPGHEEFAMGAIADGCVQVLNQDVVDSLRIPASAVEAVAVRERAELARRNKLYRAGATAPNLADKTAILVDDGMATGADMRAAVEAAHAQHAARVVAAAPVASHEALTLLRAIADEVVTLAVPEPFIGVGLHYDEFGQTPDADVKRLLEDARVPPT
ncbi:phosphoribosyltransferase [Acuticoccus mangrovi]|uniref:Phosphoribosyltransferase n=1 Tax=Acuticoccus mangrovi TaxID=2796142 RepID=A0A934IQ17_9HYPH|nr:phosphoribosyltransferase family protein [Acuticoccus mangrovi]MBJ3776586.1 phosphoribosyltransferase [Acuticoccus mangrovi]